MPPSSNNRIQSAANGPCCIGCGACVALDRSGAAFMADTEFGPVPRNVDQSDWPEWAHCACPALGIHYPDLYRKQFGQLPGNPLCGNVETVRTGYSGTPSFRTAGASGGVLTSILVHLLETKRVDAVVAVRQGEPAPEKARAILCRTSEEVLSCSQSVYIPVSTLDVLRHFLPGERYAMVCLPDQSAALRVMQQNDFAPARQVCYIVGPYTGTALYPAAITAFLRGHGVPLEDRITRLRWRAGAWPGYLEVTLASGRVLRSPKVYYNFLIPFFITRASLQSMDFANEFADLAVGDAWSPALESEGGGHSVFVTRSQEMEAIVADMCTKGLIEARQEDPLTASEMHGHMLDFKKRGGYIRNRWRRLTGRPAPDFGYRPSPLPFSRFIVEGVISTLFAVGRTCFARWIVTHIPERIIGPVFNRLRLTWKALSRPTKRKGLKTLKMIET